MKIASRSLLLATAAMAASLATGCLSVTGYDAPCPVRTVEDTLKVSVDAVPTQPESASLASDVASAARRNLANRGFRVVEDGDRDISVSLGVEQTERNRAGDFIIYEGRVCARAAIGAPGSAALDETVIEAAGERKLGEAAATRALSKVLVPQVESWVEKTVTVGKTGVRVQTVSVEYRRVDRLDKPALIDGFVSAVKAEDGVRDCQLVSETWSPRWWGRGDCIAVFRIVYDPGTFPNGPLNTISVKHPDLELAVQPSAR